MYVNTESGVNEKEHQSIIEWDISRAVRKGI